MKTLLRRALALILAAAFLSTTAFASIALGDELHKYETPLADGATYTSQVFYSNSKSDLRTEFYVTYTPGQNLSPLVSYGPNILAKRTVPALAADLEKSGKRVLTGINGDYFVMATGDPLGIVLTDGVLRSSAAHFSAIGFTKEGKAFIGKPDLSINATFSGRTLKVAAVNKLRTAEGGYYLLSEDFGANTQNTQPGVDVILAPVRDNMSTTLTDANGQSLTIGDKLKIGGRVSCVVEQVLQSTAPVEIPRGKFVLTINNKSHEWLVSELAALQPGATVELDITAGDERFNTVDCALGAYNHIVSGGALLPDLDESAAPRTAVGVKPDGSVVFYAIDGRKSGHSIGASITQVAKRLVELGCTDAVALDGGGSTTMGITDPASNAFSATNQSSDGAYRAVSTALFLVSNLSPSGTPGHVLPKPEGRILLSGATTNLSAAFADTNWFPVSSSEAVTYTAQNGSFSGAVYTAPQKTVTDTITATTPSGVKGSTTITVYQSPTGIKLYKAGSTTALQSLSLTPGNALDLNAEAYYRLLKLKATDLNFTWGVEPAALGTITPEGKFTAADMGGTGNILVTAGTYTLRLPLTISTDGHFTLVEDFEGPQLQNISSDQGTQLSLETRADYLRFGKQSLRVDYNKGSGEGAVSLSHTFDAAEPYFSLWVYGDGSGNSLSVIGQTAAGAATAAPLCTLDFSGWRQVSAKVSEDTAEIQGLRLSGPKAGGTLWIDQVTTSNQAKADGAVPKATLNRADSTLTATVKDVTDESFSKDQITLTLDGKALDFGWNQGTNTLTATLPALDTKLHRLTVTATDASGNIGRASESLNAAAAAQSSFVDMQGHWAAPYTDYLSTLGIVKGEEGAAGPVFSPDRSITRGDFALMTARWMGLDLAAYSQTSLPFADAAAIPAWSQDAVKAMYALGIMKGSEANGKTYANAAASITRAEAMTILGRIQVKGYPEAALSGFQDAASVPAWAKPYVSSLVSQGVVGGSGGTLRPMDSVSRAEVSKMLVSIW